MAKRWLPSSVLRCLASFSVVQELELQVDVVDDVLASHAMPGKGKEHKHKIVQHCSMHGELVIRAVRAASLINEMGFI